MFFPLIFIVLSVLQSFQHVADSCKAVFCYTYDFNLDILIFIVN